MRHLYTFVLISILAITGFASAFSQEGPFDHSLYGKVLQEHLEDGKVNYLALKGNPHLLDEYLKKIAELSPDALDAMSGYEKIAFYINTYNALTLKAIIDNYPVKSIKDIKGVWDRLKFTVSGEQVTLDYIEHGILRKKFKEPRIHFALVCAAKGCPKLRNRPYIGRDISVVLDYEAYKFINDKTKVRLNKSENILYISSIFKWFKEDFVDVEMFLIRYLPEEERQFIQKNKPKIRYLKYDWSLNE